MLAFGGRRWDGGDTSLDDGQWKGGSQDVLKGNMALRISSKDSLDKGVLGWWGKEIILFKESEVFLSVSGVSKDFKTGVEDWGWGRTSDNVLGAVGDVEEGIVFNVFEGRPGKLGSGGTWDRGNR